MPKRIKLEVVVDLDDFPGQFHDKESARNIVAHLLDMSIPHYNPEVTISSESP